MNRQIDTTRNRIGFSCGPNRFPLWLWHDERGRLCELHNGHDVVHDNSNTWDITRCDVNRHIGDSGHILCWISEIAKV
jgi:hypothetical protein